MVLSGSWLHKFSVLAYNASVLSQLQLKGTELLGRCFSDCLATLGSCGEGKFLACIAALGKGVHLLRSPPQMCVLLQLHTVLLSTSKYFGFSLQFGEMQWVISLLFHWGLFFMDCSF